MELPPHLQASDKVVLFDNVCKLCEAWSKFLIRYDRQERFKLCSVQSPEGQAILGFFGMSTDSFETMVLVEGNKAFTRSDAFLRVVRRLPMPWRLLVMFQVIPRILRDWLYDRIALNRYRLFGRHDHCLVPSEKALKRFISNG